MNTIICDTCIWYNWFEGSLKIDFNENRYGLTIANIFDIISSPYLQNEEIKIKTLVNHLNQNQIDFLNEEPIVYAASELVQKNLRNPNKVHNDRILEELRRFCNDEISNLNHEYIRSLHVIKKAFSDNTPKMKDQLIEFIVSNKTKNISKHELATNFVINWFCNQINRVFNQKIITDEKPYLHGIEIFAKSFATFLLRIQSNQSPNPNSFIDIYQLLYLNTRNNYKFWTNDKQIISILKSSLTSERYQSIIYRD